MKQLLTILGFEYKNYAKSKPFILITAVLVLLVGALLSYPRIEGMFKSEGGAQGQGQKPAAVLVDQVSPDGEASLSVFSSVVQSYQWQLSSEDEASLKDGVKEGKYACAVVIDSPESYRYITQSVGLYDSILAQLDVAMQAKYRGDLLTSLGVSAADSAKIVFPQIKSVTVETGKNQQQNFFYTYALMFLLYMAILLYGQFVATSVAAEKSSRAMELLITSAKPINLMFGKVLGSGLAGLTQMVAILGSGFAFYNLNRDSWKDSDIIRSIFDMPVEILLYTILFFILGYFLYSFMYGALGSLASRMEDIHSSIMPVTFLFIIAFFVSMYGLGSGNVNSPLLVVCSFIPFTSPMAMFVRICMSDVPAVQIVISVGILVLTTLLTGVLAAGIYRIGVLLYGKPPKLGELFKMMKKANQK